MRNPIKSSDPRKPAIMAAIKRKANCRKVTCVAYEPDTNTFSGVAWTQSSGRSRNRSVRGWSTPRTTP